MGKLDLMRVLRSSGGALVPLRNLVVPRVGSGPVQIMGMLPLAAGTGDGSEWRSPMGVIAIGGLAASTLLSLVVVPVAYTLVDDAQSALLRWVSPRAQRAVGS